MSSIFKTELSDYTIWYDGVVSVDPSMIEDLFLRGVDPSKIAVTEVNPDIAKFNRLSRTKLSVKEEIDADALTFNWLIPSEYADMDIGKFVTDLANKKHAKYTAVEASERNRRVAIELREYNTRGFDNVLRTLVYTIAEFKKHNVVWGVGRGSSCASYVLFLLGVHSVDTVKYGISLNEFFKGV